MNRNMIRQIVDEHSGGLKGLELMTEIVERMGPEAINPETFFDEIEAIIVREIPELGFLHYAHKVSEDTFRGKVFIYRKEPVCAKLLKGE